MLPLHLTVISTVGCPGCPGGVMATIWVADSSVAWAATPPKETCGSAQKPVPLMVTESPPAADPWLGETLVTLGTADAAAGAAGDVGGGVAGSVIGV